MKLGIALGGGGAKGFAHIGILKAFSEAGIEFDVVTGTSIGALVGAIYAAGALDDLEQMAEEIGLTDIPKLLSPAWSKSGMFSGKNAFDRLESLIGYKTIEELPKTFAAVSVDLLTSTVVNHTTGDVKQAVRASAAIPAIFTPVCLYGQTLVDGGTLEPLPVQLNRELGADFVVAVDLFGNQPQSAQEVAQLKAADKHIWPAGIATALSYLGSVSEKIGLTGMFKNRGEKSQGTLNMIEIIERTLAVNQSQLTKVRLQENPPDILIQPPVSHVGLLDFHRGQPIVALGREYAAAAVKEFREKMFVSSTDDNLRN